MADETKSFPTQSQHDPSEPFHQLRPRSLRSSGTELDEGCGDGIGQAEAGLGFADLPKDEVPAARTIGCNTLRRWRTAESANSTAYGTATQARRTHPAYYARRSSGEPAEPKARRSHWKHWKSSLF